MKNYWQLLEDLTAAQRKYLSREYDITGFAPAEEKLFLKVTKGKRDANGVPDFTGVTLCDIVSLDVNDFGELLQLLGDESTLSIRGDNFITSDYKIRGWYTFLGIVEKLYAAFDKAFGDALHGRGKSEIIDVFRQMKACKTQGDWARYPGGELYRGKRIGWEKFRKMPWRIVDGKLQCVGVYQSKLAMQSWTTDQKIGVQFSSGHEGALAGEDLDVEELFDKDDNFIGFSKSNIGGFVPVLITANIPGKDCFLNPALLNTLQRKIGHGGLNEKEVLRISTEPIRAQFTVTKEMLRRVIYQKDAIDHIFNLVSKRK